MIASRLILGGVLAMAMPHHGTAAEEGAAGLPPAWVKSYERFDNYIVERKRFFPASGLELAPSGNLIHSVRLAEGLREHLNIEVFWNGRRTLQMSVSSWSAGREFTGIMGPGRHALVLQSCGLLGYQYLYPFLWTETEVREARSQNRSGGSLWTRAAKAPEPAEDFWPNERLFLFRDFAVFPGHNPHDFYYKNNKVPGAITLGLTNEGTLVRELQTPEVEKNLRWRIYHNGRVIEKGPAEGMEKYDANRGPGSYQAFLGIEGVTGFMPVSNMVEFPLFPSGEGKCVVFPPATKEPGFPDFLAAIIPSDVMSELPATSGDDDVKPGQYSKRAVASFNLRWRPKDAKDAELLALWQVWAWDLWHRQGNPDSTLWGYFKKD